jgi:glucokinase
LSVPIHPTSYYLAIDVGGTRVKSGIVTDAGEVIRRRMDSTEGHRGADDLLARIGTWGRELLAFIPDGQSISAIGVAFTGVIDPARGQVLQLNGKIPDIAGVMVGPRLAAAFDVPCAVDNDTCVYTIGEWQHGAGRGFDNIVCLTLGTGIGSGVISGGRVMHTPGMIGGILGGHFTVDCDGPLCSCGNRGCLESVASVPAFLASVRDHLSRGYPSMLQEQAGQHLATVLFDRWIQRVGAGIVTLVHAYDPDVVIVGGGVLQAADTILPPLREYVTRHAWTWPKGRVRVEACALGDDAALIGGAAMAALHVRKEGNCPA